MINSVLAYLVIILGSVNLIRMGLFMVGSDLYGIWQTLYKKRHRALAPLPSITVVIPAHNEEHTVIAAIESALGGSYPEEKVDVVVVDDGSTDGTAARIRKRMKDARYTRVRLVRQKNVGKAHALNNGIKSYATGELVMCLDADSYLAPDALMNAARYFQDARVVALASNVKIIPTGTLLNLIQQFEYLVCYQMKRAQTFFNIEYIIGGIGSTFRRNALERVGHYDTDTVTEDIDLTFKFLREGNKDVRVIYGSDVVAYTESVLDLPGLVRQRFRWKYGRSQTFLKNTALFFSLHPRQNKLLTWFYQPFALVCDVAFFLEPFIIGYIGYLVFTQYHGWVTLASAFAVMGVHIALNVLAEDTIPWRQRVKLTAIAPSMYILFYILSYVEYVALIKNYWRTREIVRSIGAGGSCSWEHVKRTPRHQLAR